MSLSIRVKILSALHLPSLSRDRLSSYCIAEFSGNSVRTPSKTGSTSPAWNQTFEVELNESSEEEIDALTIKVFREDRDAVQDLQIGQVDFALADLNHLVHSGIGYEEENEYKIRGEDGRPVLGEFSKPSKLCLRLSVVQPIQLAPNVCWDIGEPLARNIQASGTADAALADHSATTPKASSAHRRGADGGERAQGSPGPHHSPLSRGGREQEEARVPERRAEEGQGLGGGGAAYLQAEIVGAEGVPGAGRGGGDLYVRLLAGGVRRETNLVEGCERPEWYHRESLKVSPGPRGRGTLAAGEAACGARGDEEGAQVEDGKVEGGDGGEVESGRVTFQLCEGRGLAPTPADAILGAVDLPFKTLVAGSVEGEHELKTAQREPLLGPRGEPTRLFLRFTFPVTADVTAEEEAARWRSRAQELQWRLSSPARPLPLSGEPRRAAPEELGAAARGEGSEQGAFGVLAAGGGELFGGLQTNAIWRLHKKQPRAGGLAVPALPSADAERHSVPDLLAAVGIFARQRGGIEKWFRGLGHPVEGEEEREGEREGEREVLRSELAGGLRELGMGPEEVRRIAYRGKGRWRVELGGQEAGEEEAVTAEELLKSLALEGALAKGVAAALEAPKVDLEALQAELAVARRGMALLRKHGIVGSEEAVGAEAWVAADAKLEALTENKVFREAACQADVDPFDQDLFIHYVATDSKRATGLAGLRASAPANPIKSQTSRVFITSYPEPTDTLPATRPPPAGYSGLPTLDPGPTASVHRLSYQGAEYLDAAIKPGAWYTDTLTQPGAMAALPRPRYWANDRTRQ